ncbi:MAG: CopG family transcriptional regulator [Halanaeroarchaeum sp.]
MPRYLTVVCEDEIAGRIATLARRYDTTEEEVARQLIERGIECVD